MHFPEGLENTPFSNKKCRGPSIFRALLLAIITHITSPFV